jgi:hypothetical protein
LTSRSKGTTVQPLINEQQSQKTELTDRVDDEDQSRQTELTTRDPNRALGKSEPISLKKVENSINLINLERESYKKLLLLPHRLVLILVQEAENLYQVERI